MQLSHANVTLSHTRAALGPVWKVDLQLGCAWVSLGWGWVGGRRFWGGSRQKMALDEEWAAGSAWVSGWWLAGWLRCVDVGAGCLAGGGVVPVLGVSGPS